VLVSWPPFPEFVIVRLKGAVSWDAWPKAGQSKITTVEDHLYKANLGGKKYMMGVSPWFFTGRSNPQTRVLPTPFLPGPDLPQWDKNWYCSSESLWYDRWQQVMEVMPDFVQIITCMSPGGLGPQARARPDYDADIRKGMTMVNRATSATPHRPK
jgi:hypothetical protein